MVTPIESHVAVVPWHTEKQRRYFLEAWGLNGKEPYLCLQQDRDRSGCALTKNAGVRRAVEEYGADVVVVLDDDCYPNVDDHRYRTLPEFMQCHASSLTSANVEMFAQVTSPASRGTPFRDRAISMPVAASMGFWVGVGDYDAPSQLVHGATHPMTFDTRPVYGRYFAMSGMNLAFRPADWWPWWQFIDVPRFDDIWQGFLWQRAAYERGHCFNLDGPTVRHARQSNVWANLRDEAAHLEANETLWRRIHTSKSHDYWELRGLLPVSAPETEPLSPVKGRLQIA